ncbi:hypothetical protein [Paenibacillus glacialis]|uniref:Uncharacterized protein n=1 Tax=Paenibacillus glacialis TaxID=494026 RepID=A0A168FD01_9BACL|nr:hypothetical protein [Paenibacillus glacialis]OAB36097.1 hypothetical protein PGLA_21625 [Paenibacillus glacialis]
MQRTNTTTKQPNRSTSSQVNRTGNGQTRVANTEANRVVGNQARITGSPMNATTTGNMIVCRKCKSSQIVANKRGYSFANMFKTLGWMGLFPFLLIVIGFVGSFFLLMKATDIVVSSIGVSSGSSIGVSSGSGVFEIIITIIGILCGISVFLSLPVSILVGFSGRSEIVNGCMNCGFKWTPAKKK